MKKLLLISLFIFPALYSHHTVTGYVEDLVKEYGKTVIKTTAYAGGTALFACGLYGLYPHLVAVKDGFIASKNAMQKFTEDRPVVRSIAKWGLPVVGVATGYFLISKADSIKLK